MAVRKMQQFFNSWNTRDLISGFQRAEILEIFVLPKMYSLAECLPLPPPWPRILRSRFTGCQDWQDGNDKFRSNVQSNQLGWLGDGLYQVQGWLPLPLADTQVDDTARDSTLEVHELHEALHLYETQNWQAIGAMLWFSFPSPLL